MAMADDEIPLAGGNMTAVVRVGDTVRRTAGPWTPTVHALLRHLRAAGLTCVPEPLGLDDRGREILSLLPGRAATYPLPEAVLTDATLAAAARTLRALHDATATFAAPAGAVWQWPVREPAEVVCHNDFAPYNLMFEGDALTGVIDFDLAAPGPRVRDAGYAAYRFAPLTSPSNPDVPHRGVDEQARRVACFCDAYGDGLLAPAAVVEAAVARLEELVDFIVRSAAAGDPAQRAVLERGDVELYRADLDHVARHRAALAGAR
jgi:aminoglycoside phosphotransferase (APT) family kinase protein